VKPFGNIRAITKPLLLWRLMILAQIKVRVYAEDKETTLFHHRPTNQRLSNSSI
jgi:hypothetical protein